MSRERVRELAEQLKQELEQHEDLDAEARAAVNALRVEVDVALAGRATVPAASAKAQGLVERFESDHPELTAFIQRLADALSNVGL